MNKQKNIFNYATKELSQDAFLRWLFENFDCEDECVKKAAKNLLEKFGLNVENIISVNTFAQKNKIDISVYIESKGKKQAVYIEDKTSSSEHNQLKEYNKSIEKDKKTKNIEKIAKVYYKTDRIKTDERKRVEEAGWNIIEFNQIADFWKEYTKAQNLILRSYAEHILNIQEKLNNKEKPIDNCCIAWESFFIETVIPKLTDCSCKTDISGRFSYAYLCVIPEGYEEGCPYLEVRSRDCIDNTFKARILTYGLDENMYPNIRENMRNILKNFSRSNIFEESFGKNCTKQVAVTRQKYSEVSENKFVELLKSAIYEYKQLLKILKSSADKIITII